MDTPRNNLGFVPDICPACRQACTQAVFLDEHSVNLLKDIARNIQEVGKNIVYNYGQSKNYAKLRYHDLIEKIKEKGYRGGYKLTSKAILFLKGEPIPMYSIVSKVEKRQVGYFAPEQVTCRIRDYNASGEVWSGIEFDIVNGEVIKNQPKLI